MTARHFPCVKLCLDVFIRVGRKVWKGTKQAVNARIAEDWGGGDGERLGLREAGYLLLMCLACVCAHVSDSL